MLLEKELDILAGILLSIISVFITLKKKALTVPAALAAVVIVMAICVLQSRVEAIFLILMYFVVFLVDMIFHKSDEIHLMDKNAHEETREKSEPRKLKQIVANGMPVICFLVADYLWKEQELLIAYYACIFEILTDSIASDVGVLSKKPPHDICTRQCVTPGLSGGITSLGLISSGSACIVFSIAAATVMKWAYSDVAILIISSYFGMILDSILGSRLQVKYMCTGCGKITELRKHCGHETNWLKGKAYMTNSMVNLISAFSAGFLASVGRSIINVWLYNHVS